MKLETSDNGLFSKETTSNIGGVGACEMISWALNIDVFASPLPVHMNNVIRILFDC